MNTWLILWWPKMNPAIERHLAEYWWMLRASGMISNN